MRDRGKEVGDRVRQVATVAAAVFQAAVTTWAGSQIQAVADADPRTLVQPALYAFAIWGLIFALSLGYAVYQALPANRDHPLLRRIGWPMVAAFVATGLWSVVVPVRGFVLAQVFLLAIWVGLAVAFDRMVGLAREHGPSAGERWLVALPIAVFLGWATAANAVSLTVEAGRFGLVTAGTTGEAILASILLLVGTGVAVAIIRRGKAGPPQFYLAYAATVLWALTAIVVYQYEASLLTTGAAAAGCLLVAAAAVAPVRTMAVPPHESRDALPLDALA